MHFISEVVEDVSLVGFTRLLKFLFPSLDAKRLCLQLMSTNSIMDPISSSRNVHQHNERHINPWHRCFQCQQRTGDLLVGEAKDEMILVRSTPSRTTDGQFIKPCQQLMKG